jgi:acetoacetyl-CoA synthetase
MMADNLACCIILTMSDRPLWTPSAARIRGARMTAFLQDAGMPTYAALHEWSIAEPAAFWRKVWDFCGVIGTPGGTVLLDGDRMPGTRWFPEARLNFAENLLRRRDDSDALVFWGEDRQRRRMSHAELYGDVAHMAAAFRAAGIGAGDCVAAWMPNLPETLVAMLAAASLGAVSRQSRP